MNNNSYNSYNNYGGSYRPQPQKAPANVPAILAIVVSAIAIVIGLAAGIWSVIVLCRSGSTAADAPADSAVISVADAEAGGAASVSDAYAEDITYDGGTVSVHIPQIALTGTDLSGINADIYNAQYAKVEACKDSIEDSGWPTICRMEYRWYENGDILSLVCETEDLTDSVDYTVYNISVSTGMRVSEEELLNAAGCTKDEYLAGAENAVADKVSELAGYDSSAPDYDTQLSRSTDAENIAAAVPYLGEDGQLHVIAQVFGFAGAESYYYDLPAEPAAAGSDADSADSAVSTDADELFSIIGGKEYFYSSGAGGWGEDLTINTDGTFSGSTADSDLGLNTIWQCSFTGSFGNVTKLSDYEYTVEVISLDAPTFDDYTEDGMTYSYTAPYGIASDTVYHVYLPGMPVSEIPEDFKSWIYINSVIGDAQEFPCCALYSTTAGWYCE